MKKMKIVFYQEVKKNEIVNFVKGGLKDLSISRTSFDWGVKLPESWMNQDTLCMFGWCINELYHSFRIWNRW